MYLILGAAPRKHNQETSKQKVAEKRGVSLDKRTSGT